MRLLETRLAGLGEYPLKLKYVHNAEDVSYAILSHTWGEDEVLYGDVINKTGETKEGFLKVQGALQQARDDGLDYMWIDNICIDKGSSSELQEAINSMYTWYQKAKVCYAYLADVEAYGLDTPIGHLFKASRWFRRGWSKYKLPIKRLQMTISRLESLLM